MKYRSHSDRAYLFALVTAVCGEMIAFEALAQPQPQRADSALERRFKQADKNGDGKLTLEEAKAGMPRIAKAFERLDTDKRGYLTLEQVQSAAKSAP